MKDKNTAKRRESVITFKSVKIKHHNFEGNFIRGFGKIAIKFRKCSNICGIKFAHIKVFVVCWYIFIKIKNNFRLVSVSKPCGLTIKVLPYEM